MLKILPLSLQIAQALKNLWNLPKSRQKMIGRKGQWTCVIIDNKQSFISLKKECGCMQTREMHETLLVARELFICTVSHCIVHLHVLLTLTA